VELGARERPYRVERLLLREAERAIAEERVHYYSQVREPLAVEALEQLRELGLGPHRAGERGERALPGLLGHRTGVGAANGPRNELAEQCALGSEARVDRLLRDAGRGGDRGDARALVARSSRTPVFDSLRLKNGRIVEHWGVPDRLYAMIQLGLLQPPVPRVAA